MNKMYIITAKALRGRCLSLLLYSIFFLPFLSLSQESKQRIIAQFNYSQIDSLISATVANIATDSSSFIIANTMWYVGSYNEGNAKFANHRNHFDIYIFFRKGHKFYVQRIDNYSFFKKRKVKGKELQTFLEASFWKMKEEVLSSKVDTSYNQQGQMLTSSKMIDHKLVRQVEVIKTHDTLRYEYPSEFFENKKNLETYRFKLFAYIDKALNQVKKKGKREGVVMGVDADN